jgi:uncharacterized membrane protein
MNLRMGAALAALAGLFVSAYLWLYKLGVIGTLACGTGGCETVQLSPQSRFLGVEVAAIGFAGYALLLLLTMASLQPRYANSIRLLQVIALLGGGAVLFTLYLKYLELFVIHAICRWCVGSAVLIVVFFTLIVLELRRVRRQQT